jgi:hypothetical protein
MYPVHKRWEFYCFVIQGLKIEQLERWFIVNTNRHKTITETPETFPGNLLKLILLQSTFP